MDNHLYNLIEQTANEHKSLWRIKDEYKKDAGACEECLAFWNKMEKDKKDHISELKELLKKHLA